MPPLPTLIEAVFLLHLIGAMMGAASVTYAEFFYTLAATDGIIDHHERKYLRHIYHGLTYGMVLVLLSGIALIVLEYLVPNAPQDVLAAPFWMIETLTVLVILFADGLTHKKIGWWLASAAILTGWWMILLLDLGLLNSLGYITLLIAFVIVTFVAAGVLGYLRELLGKGRKKPAVQERSEESSPQDS